MPGIERYILKQVLAATVFVTIGLTFAIWLTQSLRFIDYIVNRGLPASTFGYLVALLLPSFLGIVLPIASFCAVLFIYQKLIMDSEIVVLRAVGFSQFQLARPAIILGTLVCIVMYAITLYYLPASYRAFKDLQFKQRNDYSTVLLQEGVFNTLSDGITVYVRERSKDGELRGILVHDNSNPDAPVTWMAESGALVTGDDGPRVVMVNGNRQSIEGAPGRLSLLYFDRSTVEVSRLKGNAHTRWREPKERFINELLFPGESPDDVRYRSKLIAEGHQRLIAPLYSLAFVLIGLASLLAGEFNRRGQIRRLLAAIFCVAVLEACALALQDLASSDLRALPAMYAAALLPIGASIAVLVRRPRGRQAGLLGAGAVP